MLPSVAQQVVQVLLKFFSSLWLLQQINNQGRVFTETVISIVSRLKSAFLKLHAISKQHRRHGKGMHISDLLKLWSVWFSSVVSPVLSAAAGDRPTAGRAADGEEPAAQTHAEAAGSPARGQTKGETQTHRQTKGETCFFLCHVLMTKHYQLNFFLWDNEGYYALMLHLTAQCSVGLAITTEKVGLWDSTERCGPGNGPLTSTQDPFQW